MDTSQREAVAAGSFPGSITTVSDEVARLEQALLDLEHCASTSVSLTHCSSRAQETTLVRALTRAAHERRFVSAHLSLENYALDGIEGLVAALLDALSSAGTGRTLGLLGLLDAYFERHGSRSAEKFERDCEELDAAGDLAALCRAYLGAEDEARHEVRAFELWAEGSDLKGRQQIPGVRGALNDKTAQRALGELTRIVRALGYGGLVVFLSAADAISRRTPRQREKSYTVLRELVDNFDAGRGAVSCKIQLIGGDALFDGPRSVRALPPLLARLELPSAAEPPPPHRSWTSLTRGSEEYVHRSIRAPQEVRPAALRSLIRISQGLPPIEAVTSMSVGHEKIDRTVTQLFEHAEISGSVFGLVAGEYGSGKTHLLLHLAERALSANHPVFWLNLERMNLDLGSPQAHLHRVLAESILPKRGRPSALDRASSWTRSPAKLRALVQALEEIAAGETEEAYAAKKALLVHERAEDGASALEGFLSARDLTRKPAAVSYRHDAYRRLLLWAQLLTHLEGTQGPVLIIDEAENLYTTGVSRTVRRSALRALSFYCGGALPGACVILAMTPPSLAELRKESGELLKELTEVDSTLELEDVTLFRSRLRKMDPHEVPPFTRAMRLELAEKVRATHKSVRGAVELDDWDDLVREAIRESSTPRALIRRLVDELEAVWWAG